MPIGSLSLNECNRDLTTVEFAIDADRVYFALVLSTFERYTDAAKRVIYFARLEANHRDADHITTEHILAFSVRSERIRKRAAYSLTVRAA